MIWGMEKFHYFLYGKQFTLETDQKPVVSIYNGGDFPKNTETDHEELPIPAIWERKRNSTGRCIE